MNAFMNVMHTTTCNCAACAPVPTLGIKMPYEEEKIVKKNCLAVVCPQAAAMLSRKNDFTAYEIAGMSSKTAIFDCPKCKYEFETEVVSIVRSIKKSNGNTTGCPICNGTKVVVGYNDLATTCPQVAAMLSKKNADFATKYTMGSNVVASFTCPDCKKEFEAKICSVAKAVCPCPYCRKVKKTRRSPKPIVGVNDLASQCPQAAAMWSKKNKLLATEVFAKSGMIAIFDCPKCKHEFEITVRALVRNIEKSKGNSTGCAICAGLKVVAGYNDLATTCPQVAAMLSKKNADFATKYTMGSNVVASFTCPDCKKEFEAKICNVAKAVYPCPYCRDTKILANHMDLETYLKKNNREDILNCIRPDSPYQANEVSYSSSKTLFLNCPECGNKWEVSANYLTGHSISYMCSNCNQTTNFVSKPEQYAIRIAMGFAKENGVPNAFDEVRHIFGYNNKYGVDFVDNTRKVCMEYNGVYWHKDKNGADCYKFIKIHNAGYTFIRILEPGLEVFDKKYDIVLPKNYKHGNEYESKIMENLGYKLISLFEEIYNYKATPEIQKLVDFKEFEKWYDIHRKRISAKATENAAKCAA